MKKSLSVFFMMMLGAGSLGASAARGQTPAPAAAAQFQDASVVFARSNHPALTAVGGFAASQDMLAAQFNVVCGDTFCAGDYSNLTSLGLTCSVDTAADRVGQCVWAFSGSFSEVDAATGKVVLQPRVFKCDLGIKGSVNDLATFLAAAAKAGAAGDDGLRQVAVPGTQQSLLDVLQKCL